MDKLYFSEKNFKSRAVRSSAVCIAVTAAVFMLIYGVVNYRETVCGAELGLFGADLTPPEIAADGGMADSADLQFGVKDCVINGDTVSFTLYGRNCGEERWESDGSDFVVVTLNTCAAEARGRYYSDSTEQLSVGPQEEFSAEMVYEIENAEEKLKTGYIFSLSAFHSSARPAAEIVFAGGNEK